MTATATVVITVAAVVVAGTVAAVVLVAAAKRGDAAAGAAFDQGRHLHVVEPLEDTGTEPAPVPAADAPAWAFDPDGGDAA